MPIGDTTISITLTKNELHPENVMTTYTLPSSSSSHPEPVDCEANIKPFTVDSIHDDGSSVETSMILKMSPPYVTSPFQHTLITTLEEDAISPLFAGVEWAGTRFWAAAEQTIRVLYERRTELEAGTKRVLELGAGLGVPGICASVMYGEVEEVIISDGGSLLSQMEANTASLEIVKPAVLWWGDDDVKGLSTDGKGWDLVLCCDCIYEPLYGDSWIKLVDVLVDLFALNPSAVCIVSCERRKGDRVEDWVEKVEENGIKVDMEDRGAEGCEEMQWCEGQRTGKVEIFTLTKR